MTRRGNHEARPALRVPAEGQAVAEPHPYGQREAEQRDLREAHRADPARRQARVQHGVGRRAPLPRRPLGARPAPRPSSAGWRCRPEHPPRLRRRRSCRSGSSTRRGSPRRSRPSTSSVQRPGRVGHRPLDADGADRVRRADRRPLAATQWQEAVEIVVGMWEQERFSYDSPNLDFPERMQTPKPFQDPHPPCWHGGGQRRQRGQSPAGTGSGLLSFAITAAGREDGAAHRRSTARRGRERRAAAHARDATTGSAATRSCTAPTTWTRRRATASGTSVSWWYRHLAEFTLEWELPNLREEEQDAVLPAAQAA